MTAGTKRQRTIVASIAIAAASPMPNCLMTASSVSTKLEKTHTMISAADVITRPVEARPSTTARVGSFGLLVVLLDLCHQEHLVVHGQAEEDREHEQRHVAHDRNGPFQADQRGAVPLLEDEGHDPVGRCHNSRFARAALSGTSSERKAISNTTKLSATTIAIIEGSLSAMRAARSMYPAVWPPM